MEIKSIPRETWEQMYTDLRSRFSNDPIARRHDSVHRVIRALADAKPGPQPDEYKKAGVDDLDNLICRLGHATLLDLEADAAVSPGQRFENMRQMVESRPVATCSRLFNEDLTQAWYDIVRKKILRADVAASVAVSFDHFQIVDHYAALPRMQQRLSSLAGYLRAAGHTAEADACNRWFGQAMLGLIESEKDAGTRLLCADLLRRNLPTGSDAAIQLQLLRDRYEAVTAGVPSDMARAPVIDAELYRRTMRRFVGASTALLMGTGGLLALIFAIIFALFNALRGKKDSGQSAPVSVGKCLLLTVMLAVICNSLGRIFEDGAYSTVLLVVFAILTVALGATFTSVLLKRVSSSSTREWKLPLAVNGSLAAMYGLVIAFPGGFSIQTRWIDIAVGSANVVALFAVCIVILGSWMSHLTWRSIAFGSLMVWMLNAVLAVAFLQSERRADSEYLQKVSSVKLDELSARLGPDWQDKYLKSARAAYDVRP